MRLLFLLLIAIFVGLAPIMVYRSLGVPLPDKLKGYRNVYVPPSVFLCVLATVHPDRNLQATLGDRLTAEPSPWTTSKRSRHPNIVVRSEAEPRNNHETQHHRYTQSPFAPGYTTRSTLLDHHTGPPSIYKPTSHSLIPVVLNWTPRPEYIRFYHYSAYICRI